MHCELNWLKRNIVRFEPKYSVKHLSKKVIPATVTAMGYTNYYWAESFNCGLLPEITNRNAANRITHMILLNSYLDGKTAVYQIAPKIDERGSLVPVDLSKIDFTIKRVFLISASSNVKRGGHGHYRGRQFLMHVSGTVTVELRHKGEIKIVQLTNPGDCLLIEPGVWSSQKYADETSALLVCCDTSYDESDYFICENCDESSDGSNY